MDLLDIEEIIRQVRRLPPCPSHHLVDGLHSVELDLEGVHLIASKIEMCLIGTLIAFSFSGPLSEVKRVVKKLTAALGTPEIFTFQLHFCRGLFPTVLRYVAESGSSEGNCSIYYIPPSLEPESQWMILESIEEELGPPREGEWLPICFLYWPLCKN